MCDHSAYDDDELDVHCSACSDHRDCPSDDDCDHQYHLCPRHKHVTGCSPSPSLYGSPFCQTGSPISKANKRSVSVGSTTGSSSPCLSGQSGSPLSAKLSQRPMLSRQDLKQLKLMSGKTTQLLKAVGSNLETVIALCGSDSD